MLKFVRKYATGYFIKAMFGLIIIVFIFWGVGGFRDRERAVAEVGPYKITATEYQQSYQTLLNFYRMIYRERLDDRMLGELKLKEQAMNQLVERYLLIGKAQELNLKISDKEFTEYLSGMEAFKRDGKFNSSVYAEVLKRNGIDPKAFEERERQNLLAGKMLHILDDNGVLFSEREVREGYIKERGQVKLGYALFDPAEYKGQVRIEEKEIEETYEKEKSLHKTEPVYRLQYVVIDEKSSVKDDQAYMELIKMKDLAAYAKSKGLNFVDMGAMGETDALARLSQLRADTWLKSMTKGDISLPIREGAKSYIFQVTEKQDSKPLSKDEAMKVIRVRITNERAKVLAKARAEEAVKDKSVKYTKDTGLIPRTSPTIPNVGPIPKENADILALSPERKVYEKPVEFGGRYYVFSFIDEKQPDQAQWEKEKEAYRQSFIARKREESLTAYKEDLKKQAKVKVNWDQF